MRNNQIHGRSTRHTNSFRLPIYRQIFDTFKLLACLFHWYFLWRSKIFTSLPINTAGLHLWYPQKKKLIAKKLQSSAESAIFFFLIIGNKISCRPILSVIILLAPRSFRDHPILLVTRTIKDRILLNSVQLPLLAFYIIAKITQSAVVKLRRQTSRYSCNPKTIKHYLVKNCK